jgi:hypothetical protein
MTAVIAAVIVVTVLLVVVAVDLLRAHGRVLRRLHELDPPDEQGSAAQGGRSPG